MQPELTEGLAIKQNLQKKNNLFSYLEMGMYMAGLSSVNKTKSKQAGLALMPN